VIHQEDPTGALALTVAQRGDIDAFRSAMHRVRSRVARTLRDLGGLDHLYDLGIPRIGLGVENMDAR